MEEPIKIRMFIDGNRLLNAALFDDRDRGSNPLHFAEDVRRKEDRLSLTMHGFYYLLEALFHQRIQPAGRLIEDEHFRRGGERRHQDDFLAISL